MSFAQRGGAGGATVSAVCEKTERTADPETLTNDRQRSVDFFQNAVK